MGTDTDTRPKTHVLVLVDKSGSMKQHAPVVRSGIDEYVANLRADKDVRYRVTLAFFSDGYEPVALAVKPKHVPKMGETLYYPHGMTALYYGIGRIITDFEASGAFAEGDSVQLVVNTDGAENNSHKHDDPDSPANDPQPLFTQAKIENMIKEREAQGWTCVYLGAGQAAWSGGHMFTNRVETQSTASGYANTYTGLSKFSGKVSRGMDVNTSVAELADDANKDEVRN